MDGVRISRRRFVTAGALGTLGALLAPEAVFADDNKPELIRWDLVAVGDGAVVPGGTDVARDAATGDTMTLTGSGFAHVDEGRASGGGTFVHKTASGKFSGVYYVTEFMSFTKPGGSLTGFLTTDAIGSLDQTTGGELFVRVHAIATDGSGLKADGVLGVHCELPGGATTIKEGVTLTVDGTPLKFLQKTGATLFHVLDH
jgi:hypothetical protein